VIGAVICNSTGVNVTSWISGFSRLVEGKWFVRCGSKFTDSCNCNSVCDVDVNGGASIIIELY
jgi:hypothetical protein